MNIIVSSILFKNSGLDFCLISSFKYSSSSFILCSGVCFGSSGFKSVLLSVFSTTKFESVLVSNFFCSSFSFSSLISSKVCIMTSHQIFEVIIMIVFLKLIVLHLPSVSLQSSNA
ncbi:MAG: hypothetical protein WCG25_01640 [bacterium]